MILDGSEVWIFFDEGDEEWDGVLACEFLEDLGEVSDIIGVDNLFLEVEAKDLNGFNEVGEGVNGIEDRGEVFEVREELFGRF